jgi:hypothetical protein
MEAMVVDGGSEERHILFLPCLAVSVMLLGVLMVFGLLVEREDERREERVSQKMNLISELRVFFENPRETLLSHMPAKKQSLPDPP